MDAFPSAVPPAYGTVAPGGQQPQRAHLYVGNLSPRVTEYMLQEIFAVAGPVQGVKIIPDKAGTHGSNYGFVEYHEMRSAELALQMLSGRRIFDMEIRCNWAYQNTAPKEDLSNHFHLFAGDLAPEVNDQILAKAFSAFPSLSDARVMWDMNTGKSRGYGFLAFRDRNDAEQAVATMNGEWLGNRAIRVNWANSKMGGGQPGPAGGAPPAAPPSSGPPTGGPSLAERLAMQAQAQQASQQQNRNAQPAPAPTNLKHYGGPPPPFEVVVAQTPRDVTTIHVGQLPEGTTQQDVFSLVQSFGYVNDVRLQDGRNFAFVKFDTHENAARAIVGLQGAQMRGKLVKVFWGKEQAAPAPGTGTEGAEEGGEHKPAPNPAQIAEKAYLQQYAIPTTTPVKPAETAATAAPTDPAAHAAAVAAWNQQYGAQYAAYVAQMAQQAQQAAGMPVVAPLLAALPPQMLPTPMHP